MKSKHVELSGIPFLSPLIDIPTPPESLYIKGELPTERALTVAIVGSRNPSHYGIEVTHKLAVGLGERGAIIVSGLAYGIDSIAHKACLSIGGKTIAVLGSGLGAVYPRAHTSLAERIVESGGCLISEYPYDTKAFPSHFLERNRLISGLADVVIVTEAAARSGTLSTVNHALEQGKDVYAVPGPITSPLSAGPNTLIACGAIPITSIEETIDALAPKPAPATDFDKALLSHIHKEGSIHTFNAEPHKILTALSRLELGGYITSLADGSWKAVE